MEDLRKSLISATKGKGFVLLFGEATAENVSGPIVAALKMNGKTCEKYFMNLLI
jgi:hypothetical protein